MMRIISFVLVISALALGGGIYTKAADVGASVVSDASKILMRDIFDKNI